MLNLVAYIFTRMNFKLIAVFVSFISLHNIQQTPQFPSMDGVENSNIKIVNQSKNSFNMGTRLQLEKAFGKTRIQRDTDEMAGTPAYRYKYNGLDVFFSGKHAGVMEVKGKGYKVVLNGIEYKVGEHIDKLKPVFPKSYKSRGDNMISLGVKHKGVWVDSFITFVYNNKGVITTIRVRNDNS